MISTPDMVLAKGDTFWHRLSPAPCWVYIIRYLDYRSVVVGRKTRHITILNTGRNCGFGFLKNHQNRTAKGAKRAKKSFKLRALGVLRGSRKSAECDHVQYTLGRSSVRHGERQSRSFCFISSPRLGQYCASSAQGRYSPIERLFKPSISCPPRITFCKTLPPKKCILKLALTPASTKSPNVLGEGNAPKTRENPNK
jgi:hypothetical protein